MRRIVFHHQLYGLNQEFIYSKGFNELKKKRVYKLNKPYISFLSTFNKSIYKENIQLPTTELPTTKEDPFKITKFNIKNRIGIYTELSKPRLSALVVCSAFAGYCISNAPFSFVSFASLGIGTTLAASSANTINQIYEKKNDKCMNRTKRRPLPTQRITSNEAYMWAFTSASLSTSLLYYGCNHSTALLGLSNIFIYAYCYTPLKTKHEINTWVGSLVGAIPPLMGYAASSGEIFNLESLSISSLLFLWQFPHFFSLAWKHRSDYYAGGYQMIPCNDKNGIRTAKQILLYSSALCAHPFIFNLLDICSVYYVAEASLVNSYLMYLSYQFYKNPTEDNSKKIFILSLYYLVILLISFIIDKKCIVDKKEDKMLGYQDLNNDSSYILETEK